MSDAHDASADSVAVHAVATDAAAPSAAAAHAHAHAAAAEGGAAAPVYRPPLDAQHVRTASSEELLVSSTQPIGARVIAVQKKTLPPQAALRMVNAEAIDEAAERIKDRVKRTSTHRSEALSELCHCEVYCKLETMHVTGSFKERGACNVLSQMTPEERTRGVVAASAGNHALGLSRHGKLLGIPVTVVMPTNAPLIKVRNCRALGATVIQHGENFRGALGKALQLSLERDLKFVSPYDNIDVIIGQGTIGKEILEDVPDVDTVIVPCGGGGLIAGIATYIKSKRPDVRIIGVESRAAPTITAAIENGQPVDIEPKPTLADGLAVMKAGVYPFQLIQRYVDDVMLVNEADIALSIMRLMEKEKLVVEGAGAISLAAILGDGTRLNVKGQKVALVLCGGNIDMTTISRVIERGLARDGRLVRISFEVDDRPGSLAKMISTIAEMGGSVKHTFHDRNFASPDPAMVAITVIVETRDFQHIEEIGKALRAAHAGTNVHWSSEYVIGPGGE